MCSLVIVLKLSSSIQVCWLSHTAVQLLQTLERNLLFDCPLWPDVNAAAVLHLLQSSMNTGTTHDSSQAPLQSQGQYQTISIAASQEGECLYCIPSSQLPRQTTVPAAVLQERAVVLSGSLQLWKRQKERERRALRTQSSHCAELYH